MNAHALPTFKEATRSLQQQLTALYDAGEAAAIAEQVAAHVSGMTPSERACHPDKRFSDTTEAAQWNHYEEALLQGRPLQYVLGTAYFYGLSLQVDASVLIPRPETEELVHAVLSTAQKQSSTGKNLTILDIGTGSGCIALALKKHLPEADVWAVDDSAEALSIARENAALYHLSVSFSRLDILHEALPEAFPQLDILVSNPPYITMEEKDTLPPNVREHEPHKALFVTNHDPLQFYRKIADMGRHALKPRGRIYLELNERFAQEVLHFFLEKGWQAQVEYDMQGKERILCASMAENVEG